MLHVKKSAFLSNKILQIKKASIHCPDNQFFNMQVVSTNVLKLDENNYLWLSVDKPVSCGYNDTATFDVVMNHQQKDGSFDLNILGEARLLIDEEELENLPAVIKREAKKGKLILHVHILDLAFSERKPPVLKTITKKIKYMLTSPAVSGNGKQTIYSDQQMTA